MNFAECNTVKSIVTKVLVLVLAKRGPMLSYKSIRTTTIGRVSC